jgi:hypothetical protein
MGIKPPKFVESKFPLHKCTNENLGCGIELEIENVGEYERALLMIDPSVWGVVEDGSLRPQRLSWEFVSLPMKMSSLLAELEQFFSKNQFNEAHYSDRTSIHVHTNVLDFTPKQLATLCLVYTVVEDILFEFTNHYNKGNRESYYRDTNIYCIPWTQCRMNYEFVRQLFKSTKKATQGWQKYTALNLLPICEHGTVEWRHMHGTNDFDKLSKWLNIIGCIMQFSKERDFDDVSKVIISLNDTSAYQQFFNQIFGLTLEYTDEYARRMAEGVLSAKYSLINRNKKEETVEETQNNLDWLRAGLFERQQMQADFNAPQAFRRVGRNPVPIPAVQQPAIARLHMEAQEWPAAAPFMIMDEIQQANNEEDDE